MASNNSGGSMTHHQQQQQQQEQQLNNDVLMIISSTLAEFFDHNSPETVLSSSKILTTLLQNAMKQSSDPQVLEKYRQIRLQNPKIQTHVVKVHGALNILGLAGFVQQSNKGALGDVLVYMPDNKPANALELYLDDNDSDGHQQSSVEQQQSQLLQAICRGLDVKVKELKVLFGIKSNNDVEKNKSPTTKDANDSSSSTPFLSEEERRLRVERVKAMKKAKKAAAKSALERWEENKQERKEAEQRREALLQAKVQAEAQNGPPVGVSIKTTEKKVPLPLAKPMAPAADLEQQKEALAAAARARMQRNPAAVAATARVAPPLPATAGMKKDFPPVEETGVGGDQMDEDVLEEQDKKPAAKKRAAQDDVAMEEAPNTIATTTTAAEAAANTKEWDEFLERVPRCAPAEGIQDSSYFRGQNGDTAAIPKCLKKLFKELDGLKDSLPHDHNSSIWLRFDEESPQYIRALIAAVLPGPTPYSGGLFAFDIFVPGDYPQIPPKVNLSSRGPRGDFSFGPNLYPSGGICLSLLGTAPGPQWIPGHSSLYQVLVSIQGLLLGIEHPYFLMHGGGGWEGQVKEGDFQAKGQTLTGKTVTEEVGIDARAVFYEDNIRIGTVKHTMLEPLASCLGAATNIKKKKGDDFWQVFKPVIQAHFATNRVAIVNEVRKWMSDEVVGRNRSVVTNKRTASFAIDELNNLLPRLESQLSKVTMPGFGPKSDDGAAPVESAAASMPVASVGGGTGGIAMEMDDTAVANNRQSSMKNPPPNSAQDEDTAMDIEDTEETAQKKQGGIEIDVIEKKRQKMQEAASKGDYVRAGQLQEEVKRLEQLRKSIEEAAKQHDFIRAGRLQAQLKALTAKDSNQAPRGVARRPPQLQLDDDDDEEEEDEGEDMSDDDEEAEHGNLAEAMANMAGRGNRIANAAIGRLPVPGRMGPDIPHGLGRNVFAPPALRDRVVAPNHAWGSGHQLSAAPAVAPESDDSDAAVAPAATAKRIIPPDQLCRLRIRLPSDKSVVEDFYKSEPLSAVYRRISALLPEEDRQQSSAVAPIVHATGAFSQPLSSAGFTLLLTRPKREFSLEMHGTKNLDELNLAPSATLTVMKCSDRGVLHRGELESRLRQAQGDALDVDGLTYEGLVELTERVGAAVPAEGSAFVNLSREELEESSETFSPSTYLAKLDDSMEEHGEDECRCPICLGEYDLTDTNPSLRKLNNCGHIFHSACLETWLRTKSSCPLCKKSICLESV